MNNKVLISILQDDHSVDYHIINRSAIRNGEAICLSNKELKNKMVDVKLGKGPTAYAKCILSSGK